MKKQLLMVFLSVNCLVSAMDTIEDATDNKEEPTQLSDAILPSETASLVEEKEGFLSNVLIYGSSGTGRQMVTSLLATTNNQDLICTSDSDKYFDTLQSDEQKREQALDHMKSLFE